jgi:hypothetical protein
VNVRDSAQVAYVAKEDERRFLMVFIMKFIKVMVENEKQDV